MSIITISREMGSGGRPLAQQLAEKLGYNLVNSTKIKELAASYGLSDEAMRQSDEKAPVFIEELDRQSELNMNRIQLIVLEQALKGNVILYGRGGQDLLASVEGILRVRVIAPFEERVENWAEREWIDPERARSLVRKSDLQRDNFIRYYFDRDRNNPLSYDITVNTSRFPIEAAVEMIEKAATASWLKESTEKRKNRLRDLIILKKIQIMRLADERILDIWYDIEVENGHVTLSGPVYSEVGHQAALEGISEIEGVNSVNDDLKVVDY
jgi:cytidylate kinase